MLQIDKIKSFPNPFSPKKVKDSDEYGLMFGKAIESASKNQYFVKRNNKFKQCMDFSRGDQSIQPYLDWMNIDGKKPFVYLDYTPSPIGKKLIDTVVSKYMGIDEEIRATAIDMSSISQKASEVKDAKFRMDHGERIGALSKQAGMEFEDPNSFTPSSDAELELYKTVILKTREEMIIEVALSIIANDNESEEVKRMLLTDLCIKGIAATKKYLDINGKIKYRNCNMSNLVYSYSSKNNFSDLW